MRKLLSILIFLAIIISGCKYKIINTEKQKQTEIVSKNQDLENDANISDDLFNKRLLCSNKLNDIHRYIKESYETDKYKEVLEEVFYSPNLDTCLYTSSYYADIDGENDVISYDIYDALTLENLYSFYVLDSYEGDNEDGSIDGLLWLRAVNKTRNYILKNKVEELKK